MIAIRDSARRCSRLNNSQLKNCIQCFHFHHHDNTGTGSASPLDNAPSCTPHRRSTRNYFTNTDQMKRSDPYAALGLTWGATATEIKDAYRRLARELHPDVSKRDPAVALNEFRLVKEAYDKLMNNKNGMAGAHRTDIWEEWSFAIWRSGDIIAQERTDVAGAMRKRPAKPAESIKRKSWGVASLGHPDGRGVSVSRGEYLASGADGKPRISSSVGTGRSKWVEKKEFQPWNPEEGMMKGISRNRKNVYDKEK